MKFKRKMTELTSHNYRGVNPGTVRILGPSTVNPDCIDPNDFDDDNDDIWHVEGSGKRFTVFGDDLSPHPQEKELNTEFMHRVMTETGNGLMQAFVIEAVAKYAEQVKAMPQADRDAMDAGFMTYGAWAHCADEYLSAVAARGL